MDLKNCYLCGKTIHQGQGFIKEGALFCSQNCNQQVSAVSIRQQQKAQEIGGFLGAIGDILRGLARLAVVGFIILLVIAKACSSSDSTTSTPAEPEIELSATQETDEGNDAEEQLPEPIPEAAPAPAAMEEETDVSVTVDSTEQPNLLELMETPAQ